MVAPYFVGKNVWRKFHWPWPLFWLATLLMDHTVDAKCLSFIDPSTELTAEFIYQWNSYRFRMSRGPLQPMVICLYVFSSITRCYLTPSKLSCIRSRLKVFVARKNAKEKPCVHKKRWLNLFHVFLFDVFGDFSVLTTPTCWWWTRILQTSAEQTLKAFCAQGSLDM